MLPKLKINKNFIYFLWFRYIFFSFSYLYFYNFDLNLNQNFDLNLFKNSSIIGYKFIFDLKWLFNDNSFNFLKGKLLLLFSNNYSILPNISNLLLYALSFNNFFINSNYFYKINQVYLFYKNNYFFIMFYQVLIILYINNIIILLYYVINRQYSLLRNFKSYFLNIKPNPTNI